jgi:broad specificity phosphatase PhoE
MIWHELCEERYPIGVVARTAVCANRGLPMKVFLIRHAQCEDNVIAADLARRMTRAEFNDFLRCGPDSPLTPLGETQAAALARRLASITFDRLYSSPLPRAHATARALAQARDLAPTILDELRELAPPPLRPRGRPATLRQHFWLAGARMLLAPSSPDRLSVAYPRARTVWCEITREPAEAIAVVSHGWFLSVLLLSLRFDRRWRVLTQNLQNTGVSLVVRRA